MKFFYENKASSIYAYFGKSLAFGAHLHNHIELVLMLEGRTRLIVDSNEYIANAGDAFIIFPNQIHQYQKIDTERYFISIFPPELCPEFQNVFSGKIPVSPIIKNALINGKLLSIAESIVEINIQKGPLYHICIKGYFLILLSELFRMMEFKDSKSPDSNTVLALLNYCSENYTRDINLEKVSKALHISRYHISRLFSEKLRMSFTEYIGTLRISKACRLLISEDRSITDIAYSTGFNSIRTFNRLFLKYTGTTPKKYREMNTMNTINTV